MLIVSAPKLCLCSANGKWVRNFTQEKHTVPQTHRVKPFWLSRAFASPENISQLFDLDVTVANFVRIEYYLARQYAASATRGKSVYRAPESQCDRRQYKDMWAAAVNIEILGKQSAQQQHLSGKRPKCNLSSSSECPLAKF